MSHNKKIQFNSSQQRLIELRSHMSLDKTSASSLNSQESQPRRSWQIPQTLTQQHSNFVEGLSAHRIVGTSIPSAHPQGIEPRAWACSMLYSFGPLMNTATSILTRWKIVYLCEFMTLIGLCSVWHDNSRSRREWTPGSRRSCISRTPDSFVQSNFLMCLSAPRNHSTGRRRCRIRPCSSAQSGYVYGCSKSPKTQDRDRLVDAIIDPPDQHTESPVIMKSSPCTNPHNSRSGRHTTVDDFGLWLTNTCLHFVFHLCVSWAFQTTNLKILQSNLGTRSASHTTCSGST